MPRRKGTLDFADMVAPGESPKGFVAQTPAGTRMISNNRLKIWEEGPDYPPIKAEADEWGRRPFYKLKVREGDDRRK